MIRKSIFSLDMYHRLTPASKLCKCQQCGETFMTVKGFEAHRRDRACIDPRKLKFVFENGSWRKPKEN